MKFEILHFIIRRNLMYCITVYALRDHTLMTSTKKSRFLTPPSPLVDARRNSITPHPRRRHFGYPPPSIANVEVKTSVEGILFMSLTNIFSFYHACIISQQRGEDYNRGCWRDMGPSINYITLPRCPIDACVGEGV